MKKSKCVIQTLAAAMAAIGSLSAANASVTYLVGNGSLESFDVSIDGTAINGALAGGIQITKTAGGGATTPASYITVGTDIETLYLGQSYTYDYDTPATPFNGQTGVNPTWGAINTPDYLSANSVNTANAMQAIQNAAYLFNTYGQLTGTGLGGTTEQKAALQLAVWAALYDTDASGHVTGTRFAVNGGSDTQAITDANSWLSGLTGNYNYSGFLLYPTINQSPLTAPQELLIAAVPEAPTVIAAALLLLPFGVSTLRIIRRRKRAA
ncbi:MAG: hypothetical protein ACREFE_07245 [Limisphaerales bacterium]